MKKHSTLLFAFILALGVFFAAHFLDFPGSVPRFVKVSGGGTLLDVTPAFTVDAVYKRLADYGEEGRNSYSFRNVTVDAILPISLLPFLFVLMLNAVSSLKLHPAFKGSLLALSFIYVIFDLAENATVLALLANYPQRMNVFALILPYVTVVKRAASLLALFVPFAMLAFQYRRKIWA
jgi:hypothetical protein